MEIYFKCFDCGFIGKLITDESDDVWLLMQKANDIHDAEQSECETPNQFSNIFPIENINYEKKIY